MANRRLVERGDFPFRNYAAVAGRSRETWALYRERGPEAFGDERVVVGALKLLSDGALGSRGAALHAPYCDDPGNTGLVLIPPEEIFRLS
ncbi:MAG: amidohydrolase, partial [Candidatus Rokubacteria bacterium]|nr:amidohydrolase [Candidatus Rokubacteria bacterium]